MYKSILLIALLSLFVIAESQQSCSSSSTVQFTADIKNTTEWVHYWERCVGSGHALLGMRDDWRSALKIAHDKLGFQQVRFHGIFDDDLSVVQLDASGNIVYSFYDIDQVYDYIVGIGMKPFVELSFMPELFASGNATIFHYKGNITPPKNYTLWTDLIVNFVNHVIDRYGMEEIQTWHFEIWNEPNCGFWSSNQTEYFQLLKVTFDAVKSVSPTLSVGGPATCQSQWIPETLAFTQENGIQLDFISTHEYPTDIEPVQRNIMNQVVSKSRSIVGPDMQLFYTEYNDGLFSPQQLHDTTYASAFAIFNIIDVYGIPDLFSWWTFTDVFEEQGQQSVIFNEGFGLQTIYNIPKPSFKAFEILHETGNLRAASTGSHPTVGTLVTVSDYEIMVIIYNHNVPNAPIQTENVCIVVNNVPSNARYAEIRRIDQDNSNPIALWQGMGSPTYPTQSQINQLYQASEFKVQTIQYKRLTPSDIQFDNLSIPPQGVIAIKIYL